MHNVLSLFMFKELVSPFHSLVQCTRSKQSRPMCNCDHDDEDNDFGMAPECAFVCNMLSRDSHKAHKATKKRGTNAHAAKKTRRKTQ